MPHSKGNTAHNTDPDRPASLSGVIPAWFPNSLKVTSMLSAPKSHRCVSASHYCPVVSSSLLSRCPQSSCGRKNEGIPSSWGFPLPSSLPSFLLPADTEGSFRAASLGHWARQQGTVVSKADLTCPWGGWPREQSVQSPEPGGLSSNPRSGTYSWRWASISSSVKWG